MEISCHRRTAAQSPPSLTDNFYLKLLKNASQDNPNAEVLVAFTANDGGKALPGSAMTNVSGEAEAAWTLGLAIGAQTVSAVDCKLQTDSIDFTIRIIIINR
jgi:hypothetical protein